MSLAFARLSPTPIVQTLHHSPSAAEVALWSRYPEAPFVAISQRAGAPAARASTSSAPCCTASTPTRFTFRDEPDDYLLFLGRFTEGKGVLQAIEVARRAGMRLILAAAEDDYYREHVAPHVDGTQIVYFGEADFDDQGEAVRRRARAALPDSGARAVRPRAGRGDGLRHAGRRARSRRGPRGRRRRRHRHASSTISSRWSHGLPRVFALDRRARPRARGRALRRRPHG